MDCYPIKKREPSGSRFFMSTQVFLGFLSFNGGFPVISPWQSPWVISGKQQFGQLSQCLFVHFPFEINYVFKWNPILVPTPGIKFGVFSGPQADITIPSNQFQQKPDLFLAFVASPPFPSNPVIRHGVPQPIPGSSYNFNMFWQQANFFVEFPVHGLFRRFAMFNPALRKLPGMFTNSLTPKDLLSGIGQNNADVGTVAFFIKHTRPADFFTIQSHYKHELAFVHLGYPRCERIKVQSLF